MSFHALPAYFPRPFALASHFTLQKLVKLSWLIVRRFCNAEIVEAFHEAVERHYAALVRAIADMQRAPRRASLGAVMDELAWDVDLGGKCWEVL